MKVIVGLGNPGKRYVQTRHNIGFRVVDFLSAKIKCPISREDFYADVGYTRIGNEKICLLKPTTFMNLSGKSVKSIMDYFSLAPQDFLIILDDVELPLGAIRLRPQGSSGGHKGLQSIIECCKTDTFPRLRLGVGKPTHPIDLADYVLMPFDDTEKPVVDMMIQEAGLAVESWISNGIEITMNRFNKKENNNKKEKDYDNKE
ncbi:MAG: aminoacyl-tRNA hydrolase [Candidatus Hydrogenedens sp.]